MILTIDTAGLPSCVSLINKDKEEIVDKISWDEPHSQSKKTLIFIDKLLTNNGVDITELKGIFVNKGPTDVENKPASFTGLKVGVTIANSLKTVLNIPIFGVSLKNGRSLEDIVLKEKNTASDNFVEPSYPKPPNISKPNDIDG